MPDWNRTNAAQHDQRYGAAHRRLRRAWLPRVQTGQVICALCPERITLSDSWDLAHNPEGGPGDYLGPAHSECNRATSTTRERGKHTGRYASAAAPPTCCELVRTFVPQPWVLEALAAGRAQAAEDDPPPF